MYFSSDQRGQTLIEMIAVLFVISVGLVGALALTTNNLKNENAGVLRLTASQLAREGVELARNVRDSNWLAGEAFDTGLVDGSGHCAKVNATLDGFDAFVDCTGDSLFDARYRLGTEASGQYTHEGATPSLFYRRVILDLICLDTASNTESISSLSACPAGSEKVGIQAKVESGWLQQEGTTPSIVLIERLYNWR